MTTLVLNQQYQYYRKVLYKQISKAPLSARRIRSPGISYAYWRSLSRCIISLNPQNDSVRNFINEETQAHKDLVPIHKAINTGRWDSNSSSLALTPTFSITIFGICVGLQGWVLGCWAWPLSGPHTTICKMGSRMLKSSLGALSLKRRQLWSPISHSLSLIQLCQAVF